ncbi:MAG TPA: diacylglycerol kinase family protein [Pyrinomonadaceae bacterium]|nr:diacylglycerol kinase family protein [Pyrinomonadaceae bacterium]
MSSLPLIIVNPASASGATGRAWPGVASAVRQHFGPFEAAFTERPGEAVEIGEREARAGRPFVIACGGDGTISEVANGILRAESETELGILPSGTGGDFRRTLDIPRRAADAARALREGSTRVMDAGRVTFTNERGEEGSRFFVNVASFGMGGDVIKRVKSREGLPAGAARLLGGRLSFAAAALQAAATFEKPRVRVSLDGGRETHLTVANFCVANARYFGGGMKIAPDAKVDDGRFDVVAVGDVSALTVLANSYKLYLGTHLGMQEVRHAHARRVRAESADGSVVKLEVDGELAGRLPAEFELLPGALRVRC